MIIDPGNIGDRSDISLQRTQKMGFRHGQGKGPTAKGIAVVRLHWQVQHDLFIQLMGPAGLWPGEGGLRQECIGYRTR